MADGVTVGRWLARLLYGGGHVYIVAAEAIGTTGVFPVDKY